MLAVTLAASLWATGEEADVAAVELAPRAAVPQAAARMVAGGERIVRTADLTLPRRDDLLVLPRRDPFATFDEAKIAPRPAAAASAVPAPTGPAMPFGFAGRLVTAGGASVLLNEGAQTHVLAVGGSLGEFRLERDDGVRLEFVHVPTGVHVSLAIAP